jgi:hypothetical protein
MRRPTMTRFKTALRALAILGAALALTGCEAPAVYGSVGVSSYSGYGGFGGGIGTSFSVGGRIF